MSLTKQAFVEAETGWLLQRCIDDLNEAAIDPASAKYEAVLTVCETTSSLVKKFDHFVEETVGAARVSAPISMDQIAMIVEAIQGERERCPCCGGWKKTE